MNAQITRIPCWLMRFWSRLAEFPEVATLTESGIAGFDSDTTFVMMAPAGTPDAVVARVNAEVVRLLRSDEFTAKLKTLGLGAVANSPAEARANLQADYVRLGKVISDAGIKLE